MAAHYPTDALVLATGSILSYFGHEDWAVHAPCPRDLPDATAIRSSVLKALESAESCGEPGRRKALMTFVIVGGGPTGVEMAGALAELMRDALQREFRRIDLREVRIVLIEAGERLLAAFPEPLTSYAARRLERLGIKIRLRTTVERIDSEGVVLHAGRIAAGTVIWAAGTRAAPTVPGLESVGMGRGGKIPVDPDLSLPGTGGRIFAAGDIAFLAGEDGKPFPALAQVAQQQGRYLGRNLARALIHGIPMPPFRFHNRGNTAIIGRHAAIFDFGGGWQIKGPVAWLLWAIVHIYLLANFERRLLVATQWLTRYLTGQRGARLIAGDSITPSSGDRDR